MKSGRCPRSSARLNVLAISEGQVRVSLPCCRPIPTPGGARFAFGKRLRRLRVPVAIAQDLLTHHLPVPVRHRRGLKRAAFHWNARAPRLGYGIMLSGGLTGTPYAGLGFGQDREIQLGWRLEPRVVAVVLARSRGIRL